MSKRKQNDTDTDITITVSDLWASHNFLAPNEYSSAAIGIHSCLVRYCEDDHFAKFFYPGAKMSFHAKDFIDGLNYKEKHLSIKCQLDIERSAMIVRLRHYFDQNEGLFQNVLNQIQKHLYECMREDPVLSLPQTSDEFMQQSNQRNLAAQQIDLAYRMRRLQFYEDNITRQSMNLINLQNWTCAHFTLFMSNIQPQSPCREQFIENLKVLLNNSFFINVHPSPAVATHSTGNKDNITAKFKCRILCILNKTLPGITIDNIQPYVYHVSAMNQLEESDLCYQQSQIKWKTYSIVTSLNNPRNFLAGELSEINLGQQYIAPGSQHESKGKPHYAPLLYYIDFHINITMQFQNDETPYQYRVILHSAPFGLVTNTSQEAELFPKLFIQDLKSWQSLLTSADLTTDEITESIRRFFIHKTGIQPKPWVIPYIKKELDAVYFNQPPSRIEYNCHVVLAKILSQIDFMAEHPLLIFFHDDGLFLGICDSDVVEQILRSEHKSSETSVCAIRFGAMSRMTDAKAIGVRVDLFEKPFRDVRRYKFDTTKLSNDLGLYIIKIKLCQASRFDHILTSINTNNGRYVANNFVPITTFVDLYDSDKLRSICPHGLEYPSIWHNFYNKENDEPISSNPESVSAINTTERNSDNIPYYPANDPQHHMHQIPPQQHLQTQPPTPYYHAHQNIPQYPTPPPIIIVVANLTDRILPNDVVTQAIVNELPAYEPLLASSRIYRIDVDERYFSNSS